MPRGGGGAASMTDRRGILQTRAQANITESRLSLVETQTKALSVCVFTLFNSIVTHIGQPIHRTLFSRGNSQSPKDYDHIYTLKVLVENTLHYP